VVAVGRTAVRLEDPRGAVPISNRGRAIAFIATDSIGGGVSGSRVRSGAIACCDSGATCSCLFFVSGERHCFVLRSTSRQHALATSSRRASVGGTNCVAAA